MKENLQDETLWIYFVSDSLLKNVFHNCLVDKCNLKFLLIGTT